MRRLPAPTCLLRIAMAPMALAFTIAPARAERAGEALADVGHGGLEVLDDDETAV